uniref:Uncharacterized protein n=1 Tax=Schistocephalus solidus TaxID=70667 RepID=A0A0X3PBF0_SCHSO
MGAYTFREAAGHGNKMAEDDPTRGIMFTVGYEGPLRRIPASLVRRLTAPRPHTMSPQEKQRRCEERAKELKDERKRRLHEYNERVKRIAEQKHQQRERQGNFSAIPAMVREAN